MKEEIYDFYYSEEHEKHIISLANSSFGYEPYYACFINGIKYTEMITKGEKPVTYHFKDLKKVHTGTFENFTRVKLELQ